MYKRQIVARAMIHADGFDEYRVTQKAESQWEIALDTGDDRSRRRVTEEIDALADRLQCEAPELVFVDYVHDRSVKLRRVVREWGSGDDEGL